MCYTINPENALDEDTDDRNPDFISEADQTYELCLEIIKRDPLELCHVRKDLVDVPMCIEAVLRSYYAILDVPSKCRNLEVFKALVSQAGVYIRHLKEDEKTEDVIKCAISDNPAAVKYFDSSKQTPEIVKMIIDRESSLIIYIRPDLITDEIFETSIKKNPYLFEDLDEIIQTPTRCLLVYTLKKDLAKLFRNDIFTEDFIYEMFEIHPMSLWCIPGKLRTEVICQYAIEKDISNLKDVPFEFQTEDFINYALDINKKSFQYVRSPERYPEVCMRAVEGWNEALCYIDSSKIPDHYDDLVISAMEAHPENRETVAKYIFVLNDVLFTQIKDDYDIDVRKIQARLQAARQRDIQEMQDDFDIDW